jgi:Flp pilus assembly protein protease CpaA
VILKSTVWRYSALIAFALLMLAAAYEDFARRIIPNLVCGGSGFLDSGIS